MSTARRYPEAVAALLATAAVAWWWTAKQMAGMDAGPGTGLGTLGWFTGSWAVMMAAMMLPSFAPTVAAYVAMERRRWLPFVAGYVLVWTAVGVVAYAVFELGKAAVGSELEWHSGGRWLSAGIVALAAAYELVPLKRICLTRCRGQLGDGDAGSSEGWPAALAIGARSGVWCIGCSWALMAALFALGVMSLTWMALIACVVALEKLGPWPRVARLATAAVLGALAAGIIAAPHDVPGLVVPGGSAIHAMSAMG
jgi:predicted metal-binding membrane protein